MTKINYFKSLQKILSMPVNREHKFNTLGKLIWWKLNQLFFHVPALVEIAPGINCICYPETSYGSLMVYQKYPEYSEMDFMFNVLEAGSTFIDVGANIGAVSLLAAGKIKKGTIIAFEPAENCLENFYRNVRMNGLEDKIEIVEDVVSDVDGKENFVLEEHSEINHISNSKKGAKTVSIPSVKLDSFCKKRKLDHLDFVKIDVEGAENKVVRGFEGYLKKGLVDLLMIEINRNDQLFGENSNDLISQMEGFGYNFYAFNQEGKLALINSQTLETRVINLVAAYNSPSVMKKIKNYLA